MERPTYENNETVPVGVLDPTNSQVLAASGTSTAFTPSITVLRITPTGGACWIAIGTTPTATADTAGSHYVAQAQDIAILAGDKINSTGALSITPFK